MGSVDLAFRDAFHCYGHFYDLFLANQKIVKCRSVLEIVRKSSNISIDSVTNLRPNAIAIMMNPGKSYPLRNTPERINLESFDINFNLKPLVATYPDYTQARIMKLMNYKNWNHVRIINLSDIREPNSNRLGQLIKNFELVTRTKVHSIFCNERKSERDDALSEDIVPILLAWGGKDFLEEPASQCLCIVSTREIFGVPSIESEIHFQHPLTRRVSWYSKMIELLRNCE
ncbi:DUF1643 domain-containing protein [Peribacillus sp. NPDC097675]|uniref:DUF1643 domain-containing protein n=1 Tax=Peribacillus sp. NPDC097675 TaxID=3390618 RepID=UPI003D067F30